MKRTLQSIIDAGLTDKDEVIAVVDMEEGGIGRIDKLCAMLNQLGIPQVKVESPKITKGKKGYPSELRNYAHDMAVGDFITYMDDDDVYMPGALDTIRTRVAINTNTAHMFKIQYPNGTLRWKVKKIGVVGNVGGHCVVPPNIDGLPKWQASGLAAPLFVNACIGKFHPVMWHEDVIVRLRP